MVLKSFNKNVKSFFALIALIAIVVAVINPVAFAKGNVNELGSEVVLAERIYVDIWGNSSSITKGDKVTMTWEIQTINNANCLADSFVYTPSGRVPVTQEWEGYLDFSGSREIQLNNIGYNYIGIKCSLASNPNIVIADDYYRVIVNPSKK